LRCPMTGKYFRHPVINICGRVNEADALEACKHIPISLSKLKYLEYITDKSTNNVFAQKRKQFFHDKIKKYIKKLNNNEINFNIVKDEFDIDSIGYHMGSWYPVPFHHIKNVIEILLRFSKISEKEMYNKDDYIIA